MKNLFRTTIVLVLLFLLQGCAKTYEIHFDRLLLPGFQYGFNSPQYLESCRMEITTKEEDFDVNEYKHEARELLSNYEYYEEFEFVKYWDKDRCGVLDIPKLSTCNITIYSDVVNENDDAKLFELSYDSGKITSLSILDDGNLMCEVRGEIIAVGEDLWGFLSGDRKFYKYTADGTHYLSKEDRTAGYVEGCTEYYRYITEYYPSGQVYHSIKKYGYESDEYWGEGIPYDEDIVEDVYFNEDGSVMTIPDKLFKEHKEYVILNTWYSLRNGKDVYVVLVPDEYNLESGYGVEIYSSKENLSSYTLTFTFEYRIVGDVIVCDEFYAHTKEYGAYSMSSPIKGNLVIQDDDEGIVLTGEFPIGNRASVDCQMTLYDKGYSDFLYEDVRRHIHQR